VLHALIAAAFGPGRFAPYCSQAPGAPAWTDPTPATVDESACRFARVVVPAGGCSQAGGARSVESTVPVTITFVNRRYAPVTVEWLDFQGAPMAYGTVAARGQRSLSTFVTHAWRLAEGGACVTFGVAGATGTFLLAEESDG